MSKATRFWHGERVLPFDGFGWQCPSGRADPADGSTPNPFSRPGLMAWTERETSLAWKERLDRLRGDRPRGEVLRRLAEQPRRRAG